MEPLKNARLTCVSNFPVATYSGMLPGVLAGQYEPEQMQIDLVRFCASVGARLIVDEVTGLDREQQHLLFANRPPVRYDALSIGVGSVPVPLALAEPELLLPIKPMQTFLQRLRDRVETLGQIQSGAAPLRIAIVGAGLGGVEVTFCLPTQLKKVLAGRPFELTLVSSGDEVPNGALKSTQQLARQLLSERKVQLITGQRVTAARNGLLEFANREPLPIDLVVWAPSASPPPLLDRLGDIPRNAQGFLATNESLQLISGDPIFAVGDTGSIQGHDVPKAGVYAVRQGMVLWPNLKRIIQGEPLKKYEPQSKFLKLINTGDGKAILEYHGFRLHNRAALWLKDQIDSRFMEKYQDYRPMPMQPEAVDPQAPMRCAGCGGKVAGSVLSRVIRRLDVPQSDQVLLGLDQPDDAAVLRGTGDQPITATVDFFSAPLDDAYLVGRIATLNAASDLFAMGTRPAIALAMSTIPVGPPRQQERLLEELLAGSLFELKKMGATLVGGHTTEGPQTMLGFTMLSTRVGFDATDAQPRPKSGLRVGDQLLLTKPIGTGALLAAHMRAACHADWMSVLLESMLCSNQDAAETAIQHAVQAITDVTGFGLAGHLIEMLNASQLSCRLSLDLVPTLPGAEQLVQQGIESTLTPHNRDVEHQMSVSEPLRQKAAYRLLFDPQTSGGLLIAVSESELEDCLASLQSVAPHTVRIGEIIRAGDKPTLEVV